MLKRAALKDVRVLPGLFRQRMDLNEAYLLELDSTCLLQNFYLEAGIVLPGLQVVPDPSAAKMHWGWEAPSCQLRGHFLGHWLSAAASLCANGSKPELRAKLEYIVSELARCQQLNGGEWVGSIPEKYFAMMKPDRYIWSPQYTMHKTIMGLKDVYDLLGNQTAVDILDHLADWYVRWVDDVQESDPAAVFSGEQAGMLEVWADLFALTGKEKYRKLIAAYEGNALFDRLDEGTDALTDDHANASIPVSHGAGRLFEITGDDKWMRRMETFWKNAVTDRGMFATTASNAGEFWIPPHAHAQYLTGTDQEF
ncbi:MAG: glycoside hydrolase family 127 protein, partial [Clostridia bacterium]|nr:glycoside hydrolase family 127 protein [Clostridia bacterium]